MTHTYLYIFVIMFVKVGTNHMQIDSDSSCWILRVLFEMKFLTIVLLWDRFCQSTKKRPFTVKTNYRCFNFFWTIQIVQMFIIYSSSFETWFVIYLCLDMALTLCQIMKFDCYSSFSGSSLQIEWLFSWSYNPFALYQKQNPIAQNDSPSHLILCNDIKNILSRIL